MIVTIHTYKRKQNFKGIDLIQFEQGKLCLYKPKVNHIFKSFYQYDIKFICVQEEE